MKFPIKIYTIKSECSIVYIEGSKVKISKYCFSYLCEDFALAKSAEPDERPRYAAFHLGLHCLPKYPLEVSCF